MLQKGSERGIGGAPRCGMDVDVALRLAAWCAAARVGWACRGDVACRLRVRCCCLASAAKSDGSSTGAINGGVLARSDEERQRQRIRCWFQSRVVINLLPYPRLGRGGRGRLGGGPGEGGSCEGLWAGILAGVV